MLCREALFFVFVCFFCCLWLTLALACCALCAAHSTPCLGCCSTSCLFACACCAAPCVCACCWCAFLGAVCAARSQRDTDTPRPSCRHHCQQLDSTRQMMYFLVLQMAAFCWLVAVLAQVMNAADALTLNQTLTALGCWQSAACSTRNFSCGTPTVKCNTTGFVTQL